MTKHSSLLWHVELGLSVEVPEHTPLDGDCDEFWVETYTPNHSVYIVF